MLPLSTAVIGQVTDKDGQPLTDSYVQFDEEQEKFKTQSDGFFYRIIGEGRHAITASAPGISPHLYAVYVKFACMFMIFLVLFSI